MWRCRQEREVQIDTTIQMSSIQLSGDHIIQAFTKSSVASSELIFFTLGYESNEPTFPDGFGRQTPLVTPSLNYLNLPPNWFNIVATMVVVRPTRPQSEEKHSPLTPVPSVFSSISTPPRNISGVGRRDNSSSGTVSSDDEPQRFHLLSTFSPLPPPRRQTKARQRGVLSGNMGSVAERLRGLRITLPGSNGHPRSFYKIYWKLNEHSNLVFVYTIM